MQIFKDKELTQEIGTNFDFGIVPAGETRTYEYYVKNNKSSLLKQLTFSVAHEELKILEYPTEIQAFDVKKLVIVWSPSVTLEEGLRVELRVLGIELFG